MTGLNMRALSLLALAVLAGCGSDTEQTVGGRAITDALSGLFDGSEKAPAADPEAGLTRAAFASVNQPAILVRIESADAVALLGLLQTSATGVQIWASGDSRTLAYREGVIVSTRGLPDDLMSASVPPASQLARGTGSHDRTFIHLNGEDQPTPETFRCSLAVAGQETIVVVQKPHTTRHITESCTGPTGSFTNDYWFENGSFIRQSRQRLGELLGYVTTKRVVD